ncbi:fibroblast growth factor receptor substrate 2 [Neocloeon triangulifer]|uniref:fibroblast growth factor receptor substrate 2 n=1 Tax=Neocloeon triangulifer TaxID=2078957 RepID=UPI00286FA2E1|nr:fibroblast growth factor receptor substrate 2 [Neocloeon triangulifer]
MGCISSKPDINDVHAHIFRVMNLDDAGQVLCSGQLEVSDHELILYQHGKNPVKWPLRCLRRYGFDADVFTFESGRRCVTGPGIYAFKCQRAEHLFNLLQLNVQALGPDDTLSRDLPAPTVSPPGTLPHNHSFSPMVDSPNEPNYLEPLRTSRSVTFDRHSLGLLSPQTSVPVIANRNGGAVYANDLPPAAQVAERVWPVVAEETVRTPTTPKAANVFGEEAHLYMNVGSVATPEEVATPVSRAPLQVLEMPELMDPHFYANLSLELRTVPPLSAPEPVEEVKRVNYIELDLDGGGESSQSTPLSPANSLVSTPTAVNSPKGATGYASIDFDKTAALSSIDQKCLRKTRHNSSKNEVLPGE